jgi:hypothetical protein
MDHLLYKLYKLAGYKFTQFVEAPTFKYCLGLEVLFLNYAYQMIGNPKYASFAVVATEILSKK